MRLLAALTVLFAAPPLAAQEATTITPDCALIDTMLEGMVAKGRTVGASTLVWQSDREVCFETAGMADREAGRPFARDTLFQIFSMTKPVTGVALMQLWEQGKFGLDDPLADHLPEYATSEVIADPADAASDATRPPSRAVTIRDVLRHTAGFSYGPWGEERNISDRVWTQVEPLSYDKTLAEFSQAMAKVPLLHDPGAQWSYSAAVDVQARLVEVLSGQPFVDYVRDHIFLPLGMHDSAWRRSERDLARLARIYVAEPDGSLSPMPRNEWLEANFMGKPMTMGGSGIVTTVDDYMRFARMLLGEGELDGVRLLQPATVRLMATDHLDPRIAPKVRSFLPGKGNGGFGFGFFVRTGLPLSAEENRGSVGEFFWDGMASNLFWVDPHQQMAVVFATQKIDFDGTLHHDLRDAVYGSEYPGW